MAESLQVFMDQFWYTRRNHQALRSGDRSPLRILFYRAASGREPVREWLNALGSEDRGAVGQDIKTAQYGWPLGMPLVRKLEPGLWEVRSHLKQGIARVLFTVDGEVMVLLHGFTKKTVKTPANELKTARRRLSHLHEE